MGVPLSADREKIIGTDRFKQPYQNYSLNTVNKAELLRTFINIIKSNGSRTDP